MKTPHATTPTKPPFLSRPLPPPPRLWGWAVITILLMATIWLLAPQQLPVTAYKLSLVSLAGVVGYWLDRSLFPYARPDVFLSSDCLPDADPMPEQEQELSFGEDVDCTSVVSLDWMAEVPAPALLLGLAMLRRALIVGCAMLAMGLGA